MRMDILCIQLHRYYLDVTWPKTLTKFSDQAQMFFRKIRASVVYTLAMCSRKQISAKNSISWSVEFSNEHLLADHYMSTTVCLWVKNSVFFFLNQHEYSTRLHCTQFWSKPSLVFFECRNPFSGHPCYKVFQKTQDILLHLWQFHLYQSIHSLRIDKPSLLNWILLR